MGLETIAILGLSLFQADAAISQSKDEARATVQQGELAAKEKSKETRLKAARIQSSFLTSGLTLEGTAMNAIQQTFATGKADVNQIISNTNTRSKNIISSGRTQALGKLAGSVSGGFGVGDIFDSSFSAGGFTVPGTGSASSVNDFGIPIPGTKPTRINF